MEEEKKYIYWIREHFIILGPHMDHYILTVFHDYKILVKLIISSCDGFMYYYMW